MTEPLMLRTAFAPYPHVRALRTGAIATPRVRFDFEDVPNITRAFRRMVRTLDFDLCEIALTTLAQAIASAKPLIGLPVVVMRGFHHGALVCPQGSPLNSPADLRGKRVGVRAYSQTTGVWLRGILLEAYGIDHRDITWVTEEDAHVAEYSDPPNVQRIAPEQDLRAMLMSGDIDAGIALAGVDASKVRPLIADPDDAAAEWFRNGGVYPANHVLCLKSSLVQQYPWLPEELLRLFVAARISATEPSAEAKWSGIVGDPLPHGLGSNHAAIGTCLRYAAEQGLVQQVYRPEEIFVS